VDNEHIGLVRYDADGSLDSTFGSGGIAFTNMITTFGTTGFVYAVVRQSDGKLVVGGNAAVAGSAAFMLARYLGDCASTPRGGCRTSQTAALKLKDNAVSSKNRLLWKWRKGQAASLDNLGTPTGTTSYSLCVYVGTAAATAYTVPGGAHWTAFGTTGFKYKDPSGAAAGIQKVIVKSGADGKAGALVRGKGVNLPNPTLPLALPVTAQLENSANDICYTSAFGTATENSPTSFKAQSR
jgi:hypothetical protein